MVGWHTCAVEGQVKFVVLLVFSTIRLRQHVNTALHACWEGAAPGCTSGKVDLHRGVAK